MLDQSTVDKLHAMRFPKMAEAYILQSKDPRYEAQSFEERFAALVDAEYQNRIVNRRRRLLKAAKLEQSHARLEEINYTCGRRLNRRLIEKLGTCEYIERNLNVFITGATAEERLTLLAPLGMRHVATTIRQHSSACRTTSQILPWLVKRIPTARY